jgi:hypothetical protein
MARTKRNKQNLYKHSSTMSLSSTHGCDTTFDGLQKWYACEFKKIGYIILAKERGELDRVTEYITCLKRLHRNIHARMKIIHDKDRKCDLEIMCHNLCILMDHANKDFN